jgi:hypothetical protein
MTCSRCTSAEPHVSEPAEEYGSREVVMAIEDNLARKQADQNRGDDV